MKPDGIVLRETYRGVTITVRRVSGTIYVASNDYGEPKMDVRGFLTADEAMANERDELDRMAEVGQ